MIDAFLNLSDKPSIIGFLIDAIPYADKELASKIQKTLDAYKDDPEDTSVEKLANAARELGYATWPARIAVKRYLSEEGSKEEWSGVLSEVSESTAKLMKKIKNNSGTKKLEEVLSHGDVGDFLKDKEMLEINDARKRINRATWKAKKEKLDIIVNSLEKELEGYKKRLDSLREMASAFPSSLQDEIFSKINHYEDRILFSLEMVPLEILDEEIQYYTEQKEISPLSDH